MESNSMGLDPKGNIAILKGERPGGEALGTILFSPANERKPFLVVRGYDPRTGSWSEAREFANLVGAWEAADPNILGLFPVFKGDIEAAVERAGFEPSAESVSKVTSDGFDECVWDAIGKSIDARVARSMALDPANRGGGNAERPAG